MTIIDWNDCSAKQRLYYRSREHQQAQLEMVAKAVKRAGRLSLLDVGCGYGDLTDHLFSTARYLGIDADKTTIESARETHPHHHFLHSTTITPADLIVAVAAIQSPENDPAQFIRDLWRHSLKGAVFTTTLRWEHGADVLDWCPKGSNPRVTESDDDFFMVELWH